MTIGQTFRNVAELAQGKFPIAINPTFKKIFSVKVFEPECRASPELAQKYGVATDNVQQVVSIQNRVTSDLTWWNPARKTKPQNFKTAATDTTTTAASSSASGIVDPTGGGGPATCDFCGWQNLTAEDTFGRIEGPYAVTASNLFKYAAPYQGVVLFKHHDPLSFNFLQVSDLLNVADGWFYKAMLEAEKNGQTQEESDEVTEEETLLENINLNLYPLLVWNCLGRAGASQFHGHAQVMVSGAPFPAIKRESDAVLNYRIQHSKSNAVEKNKNMELSIEETSVEEERKSDSDADYYQDLVAAHEVVGLARQLILPCATNNSINTGEYNFSDAIWDEKISGTFSSSESGSSGAQINIHGSTATAHVSLCPTKDAEIVIHGSSITCPAFQMLFYAALRALIDDLGVQSFNAGIHNIPTLIDRENTTENNNRNSKQDKKNDNTNINFFAPPVVARVVSRGRASGGASDFGGLEVFAGASIGHTDPWTVMKALDTSLKRALKG